MRVTKLTDGPSEFSFRQHIGMFLVSLYFVYFSLIFPVGCDLDLANCLCGIFVEIFIYANISVGVVVLSYL